MPLNHSSKYAQLTDDQYVLIGKIVIEFSNIDYLMGDLLCRMLMTNQYLGRSFTGDLFIVKIQHAIKNACKLHAGRYHHAIINSDDLAKIAKINSEVDALREKRNRFAHNLWSRWSDEKLFGSKMSAKALPNNDSIVITNTEMEALYTKAYEVVEELMTVLKSLPDVDEDELFDKYKRYKS